MNPKNTSQWPRETQYIVASFPGLPHFLFFSLCPSFQSVPCPVYMYYKYVLCPPPPPPLQKVLPTPPSHWTWSNFTSYQSISQTINQWIWSSVTLQVHLWGSDQTWEETLLIDSFTTHGLGTSVLETISYQHAVKHWFSCSNCSSLNERHWSAKPSAQQCMWLYLCVY